MADQNREYQQKSIEGIRDEFKKGNKKVLLWLATGGGKTKVFCDMVKEASSRGKRAIVVVRGRKLVDQASQRLFREHVPHGVLMSGHWNFRPQMPIQVCSIDTLISRGLKPDADLIIIDEAHLATSEGYKQFLSQYNTFVVAVTATPYVDGGLKHVADAIVHPIKMQGLIDLGYLVPFRYFAPAEPDLSSVKVSSSTKDYVTNDLEKAMVAGQLTGNIVDHYKKLALGLPAICFAVNINHSRLLTQKFIESGIHAEHCDADVPDAERNEIIKRLESGTTKVICNVGIFCTGVDIPSLRAIIMARPTKSKNLYIQQAGRGTRLFGGKENCLLLDHAGNIRRHGLPTDEPDVDLNGKEKKTNLRESKICKNCFAVFRSPICPECGVEPPPAPNVEIKETNEELKELTNIEIDPIKRMLNSLIREGKEKSRKPAWAYYKLIDKFGFDKASSYLPDWFVKRYNEPGPVFNSPYVGTPIKRGD